MRQTACHGNHLVVCTLRNISMTELIVDVIKCTPISASNTRTHVVVDVHKTVGDVHIRAWREGNPVARPVGQRWDGCDDATLGNATPVCGKEAIG